MLWPIIHPVLDRTTCLHLNHPPSLQQKSEWTKKVKAVATKIGILAVLVMGSFSFPTHQSVIGNWNHWWKVVSSRISVFWLWSEPSSTRQLWSEPSSTRPAQALPN
uniref:Uncharacterized protein n=1 Tax=Eutreptiella gymnastica TaxID=73025 RepID=A0A7S1I5D2_9EUGL|mmetsp:Transcript_131449/g.227648  ORF Transcript_131449/g.227648 Transcript_131449/m.227648 type:complete len:106 (+) Transcript_131449:636-953(+)